jgi:hypothetical protein
MNPSLLLIPDRYKAAKLYSQIPDSGAGDLTFARNSNATRVNSAGLIEKVRTNLLQQSQNLAAAAWSLIGTATRTANYGTAPDGTQTSTRIQWTSANSFELFQYTGVAAPVYGSVFIKGTAGETIKYTGNSVTLNGSWQRIEGAIAIDGSNTFFTIVGTAGVNTAFDFELWGAQAEAGDIATDYIPTTTAAVSVGITANIPRLDYTGGGCPSLLLEPQRTNLALFSEQFNNAAWEKVKATVTSNDIISPDGTLNADKIVFDDGTSTIRQPFALAGATATARIYVKGTAGETISIDDLFTTYEVITLTGEWQLIGFTAALATGRGIGVSTFGGATARTIWLWGAQMEAGSYPTSYIPTLGASVTRLADAASKTGISSLIGQTEGTLFVEEYYDASVANNGGLDDVLVALTDGTTNNVVLILHYGVAPAGYSNAARFFIRTAGATQVLLDSVALPTGTYKMALAYSNNDVVAYINGVQIGTDTSATIPATSVITLVDPITTNAATKTVNIKTAALYPVRLSNSELASLTSL